jgi:hypothetical protein
VQIDRREGDAVATVWLSIWKLSSKSDPNESRSDDCQSDKINSFKGVMHLDDISLIVQTIRKDLIYSKAIIMPES